MSYHALLGICLAICYLPLFAGVSFVVSALFFGGDQMGTGVTTIITWFFTYVMFKAVGLWPRA